MKPTSDIAFTPSVKAIQERHGSRAAYAKLEQRGGFREAITGELAAFIGERDSFYLATASHTGRPYIQHRGGPPGFLRVLDEHTLAFADVSGNKQFISMGNLAVNDAAFLFLIDYSQRRRIKIWGRARFVEGDAELLARVSHADDPERPERVLVFTVEAWDENCPRHITPRFTEAQIAVRERELRARIRELEAENARLRLRSRPS